MKRIALLFLSGLLFLNGFAQNRVSDAAVATLRGGKFYIKTHMMEIAGKDGVNMSRVSIYGMNVVSIGANGYTYLLDEQKQTYQAIPNPQQTMDGNLLFSRQGTCKVDGQDGWYFDEYKDASGQPITFYYNSDKVAILELGESKEDELGPMWLHVLQKAIPQNMYFCLHSSWKSVSGGAPTPPTCATPWKDTEAANNLACGKGVKTPVITDKRTLTQPVQIADLGAAAPTVAERMDLNVTEEGVHQALVKLQQQIDGMDDSEVADYVMRFNNDVMCGFRAGAVTGQLIEEAIAHAIAYPNALTLNNIGILYLYKDEAQNAQPYFEAALKYDPENPTVLANLAESYFEQNKLDEAEKYAKKCLAIAPEFGSALQVMTSIYFSRGKHIEGMGWLLKTAPHYFTDITASQFSSLWLAIEELRGLGSAGYDVGPYFEKIYTTENLRLLEEATKAGFEHHYLETAMGDRKWNWPVKTTVEFSWKYYQKCSNEMTRKEQKMRLCAKECANRKGSLLDLYLLMGSGNLIEDMTRVESNLEKVVDANGEATRGRAITGKPGKVEIVSNLPNQDKFDKAYVLQSKLCAEQNDGQILYDARQYWCLRLWQQLFQLKMEYESGGMCTKNDKGYLIGYFPKYYADYLIHQKNLTNELDFADDKRDIRLKPETEKWMEQLNALEKKSSNMTTAQYEAAKKAIDRDYLKRMEEIYKAWYGERKQIEMERLGSFREYYTQHYQPVMESYWKKMNEMCVWCDSKDVIDYYLYIAEAENLIPVEQAFDIGSSVGSSIYADYKQWRAIRDAIDEQVEELDEEINELEQEIDRELVQELPHPNGCSKFPCELSGGVDLVAREFSVKLTKDGKFILVYTNKETGGTYTYNVTDGTKTSKELYLVTAKEKADAIENAKQVRRNLYEAIGNEALGIAIGKVPGSLSDIMGHAVNIGTAASGGFHSVDEARQRYIIQDGAGNILGARKTVEAFKKETYSYGDYSVSHSTTESCLLTGGAKNKQYHTRAAYKVFFLQVTH